MEQGETSGEKLLDVFIEQLMKDKGWSDQDPERKARLKLELEEKAERAMGKGLLEAMSDQELDELNELVQNEATDAQLKQFFNKVQVNYAGTVADALVEFRQDILNDKFGKE